MPGRARPPGALPQETEEDENDRNLRSRERAFQTSARCCGRRSRQSSLQSVVPLGPTGGHGAVREDNPATKACGLRDPRWTLSGQPSAAPRCTLGREGARGTGPQHQRFRTERRRLWEEFGEDEPDAVTGKHRHDSAVGAPSSCREAAVLGPLLKHRAGHGELGVRPVPARQGRRGSGLTRRCMLSRGPESLYPEAAAVPAPTGPAGEDPAPAHTGTGRAAPPPSATARGSATRRGGDEASVGAAFTTRRLPGHRRCRNRTGAGADPRASWGKRRGPPNPPGAGREHPPSALMDTERAVDGPNHAPFLCDSHSALLRPGASAETVLPAPPDLSPMHRSRVGRS